MSDVHGRYVGLSNNLMDVRLILTMWPSMAAICLFANRILSDYFIQGRHPRPNNIKIQKRACLSSL